MTFRPFVPAAFAAFLTLLVCAAASAQTRDPFGNLPPGPRRFDISGSGGFLLSTDWSKLVFLGSVSPVSGALEQVLVRDLVVDPGPIFDATVTYWEGRYGFRAHGGFAHSCLAAGRRCSDLARVAESPSTVGVDTYVFDVGGAIGLIDYQPNRWVWPYVFGGFGAVTYNLDRTVGPPLAFIERRPPASPGTDKIIVVEPDTLLVSVDELGIETKFALNAGIGSDFRIPAGPASLGVRVELSDHIHRSPIDLDVANIDSFAGQNVNLNFGIVHNLRAAAGIVVQFGR